MQAQIRPSQATKILGWYEQLYFADSVIQAQQLTIEKQADQLTQQERQIEIQNAIIRGLDSTNVLYKSEVAKHVEQNDYYKDLYKQEKPKKWIWGGIPTALLIIFIAVSLK